jgi:hypothetical protein
MIEQFVVTNRKLLNQNKLKQRGLSGDFGERLCSINT